MRLLCDPDVVRRSAEIRAAVAGLWQAADAQAEWETGKVKKVTK